MSGGEGEEPPRGLFTPLYWVVIAAGLALTLAGAAVGLLGPRLLDHRTTLPAGRPALTAAGAHGRGARPIPPMP